MGEDEPLESDKGSPRLNFNNLKRGHHGWSRIKPAAAGAIAPTRPWDHRDGSAYSTIPA